MAGTPEPFRKEPPGRGACVPTPVGGDQPGVLRTVATKLPRGQTAPGGTALTSLVGETQISAQPSGLRRFFFGEGRRNNEAFIWCLIYRLRLRQETRRLLR